MIWLWLTGCLLLAEPPVIASEEDDEWDTGDEDAEPECEDEDCAGGYACDGWGDCNTSCIDSSDCKTGYFCCNTENCGSSDATYTCIEW